VPVDAVRAVLDAADAVLVADYGAGTTADERVRELLAEAARRVPVVWDPHPRGAEPVPGVALATPNRAEASGIAARHGDARDLPPDVLADRLRGLWSAGAVAVTAGADGAYLAAASGVQYQPASRVSGDPCGAGDRFASTATVALAQGRPPGDAVAEAVRAASAWVAAGGAEGFRTRSAMPRIVPEPGPGTDPTPEEVAARLRIDGRRLVATGGCFDLLHAGHVGTLQAARRLGDALVVLLNSDASVRRLKGPARPVVPAEDRARVLLSLDCVDAVLVFDEDEPSAVLARLRPDVWAKGGDYDVDRLPEAAVVRAHGGRTVLLPYLEGRSTTALIARSAAPAA
jgi:D-beta-D-heptose 7-phosphate kinase / D-beta-D-heptose 1-phosphate adenosyltransferase